MAEFTAQLNCHVKFLLLFLLNLPCDNLPRMCPDLALGELDSRAPSPSHSQVVCLCHSPPLATSLL